MATRRREKTRFVCQHCGFESPKWIGRCSECGAWNSMVEEKVTRVKAGMHERADRVRTQPTPLAAIDDAQQSRIQSSSQEFNRVLGGGIVAGSAVLVGGDPGIGKSTIMLQEGARLARQDFPVLYVTGEESDAQIKMRANRLGLNSGYLWILSETNLDIILEHINTMDPRLLVIDSVQTIYTPALESAPGSVSQIRESAFQLITLSKTKAIPLFLIGHVTKEGFIAGPKVLEHMVDTLLYFEGDKNYFYRILRAVKNRFGSTNEIGIFEMTSRGLVEVPNPSEMFLSQRRHDISGSAVISVMEGTRSILLETQALVSPSNYGYPQRTATGVDAKRLSILLAVLEKRAGLRVGTMDVFVNAVGGVRIDETAADMGIAVAIVSSIRNQPINPDTLVIGEIGLGGEIRAVSHIDKRLQEAEKLGFRRAIVPAANKISKKSGDLKIVSVHKLKEAIEHLF